MNWYPFDKQVCSMKVAITEDLNDFIKLINNGHDNLGQQNSLYTLFKTQRCNIPPLEMEERLYSWKYLLEDDFWEQY